MFVRGEGLKELLDYVEFELHPSFQPSKVKVWEPPYEITRTGWGIFEIGVKVSE